MKKGEKGRNDKKTPLGWIPDDWKLNRLESIAEISQGISKGRNLTLSETISLPYLRVANVLDGEFNLNEIKEIQLLKSEKEKYLLKSGDLLITEGGDPDKLGRGGIWKGQIDPCVFQNHLFRIRPQIAILNPSFLSYYIAGKRAKNYFLSCAKQTTGIASINSSQVKATPIVVPPLPEQKKIAKILSTWDEAISKTQKLVDILKERNKGLAQLLLTGKKRLKGFREPWRKVKFQSIFKEKREIANASKHPLLSVTKNGIVSQEQYFKKEIASEDTSKYLIIKKGDFVMSGLNFWMGSVDILTIADIGMVSPAYKTFVSNKREYSLDFLSFWVKGKGLHEALIGASIIGASIVRRNLDKEMLQNWEFSFPAYEEQKQIARVLLNANEELLSLERAIQVLRFQKKGLMQKLLTGEIRVKI